jgi:tetratricopeptide (TPR) repeat protein
VRDRFGEVDVLVGEGRLATDAGRLDDAAVAFGEAIALAGPIEYALGEADGVLGLGDVALHSGRLDQALAGGLRALDTYTAAGSALGQAEANRLLGDVHLRRGQLSQAITVFERALRAFHALHTNLPYARALLGAAEANRRRANPRRAGDLFTEARTLAETMEQPVLSALAVLGLGEIARRRGESDSAATLLDDAARRFSHLGRQGQAAMATFERARLALTRGELGEAQRDAQRGRELATSAGDPGQSRTEAMAACVASEIALTLGQFERARKFAEKASPLAERDVDEQARVEAALCWGEVELAGDNLTAAVGAFNRAAALAQSHEAVVAEALAAAGLGRTLLRRELNSEAAATLHDALNRLRGADDPVAQARIGTALGEARLRLGDLEAARSAFVSAAQLAGRSRAALLEAEALGGEGRTLLETQELEAANGMYSRAMSIVERVAGTIPAADQWGTFFDRWYTLYADTIFALASEQNGQQAQAVTAGYAGHADREGRARAAQRLREFEQALPTRGADLTREDIERNKAIAKILGEARKTLGK